MMDTTTVLGGHSQRPGRLVQQPTAKTEYGYMVERPGHSPAAQTA